MAVSKTPLGLSVDLGRLVTVGRQHGNRCAFRELPVQLDATINHASMGNPHAAIPAPLGVQADAQRRLHRQRRRVDLTVCILGRQTAQGRHP